MANWTTRSIHWARRSIETTKSLESASKTSVRPRLVKVSLAGMRSPKSKNGFPPSRVAFRPLKSASEGLRRFLGISAQRHVDRRLRQLLTKAALIEFGHDRAFQLIAFVQESEP